MKWRLKSAGFKLLSATPFGEHIYSFIQRHITRSTVITPERLRGKVAVALNYLHWMQANGHSDRIIGGTHFDFGSGWHPTLPLVFYASGVKSQRLLDLAPVMNSKAIAQTIELFRKVAPPIAKEAGAEFQRLPPETSATIPCDKQLQALGITYNAPYGNLLSSLGGQADFITSTQVLLHIEPTILLECLRAIYHALKPGGIFLATIHLHPLYGGLDLSTNSIRHLVYSPERWRKFGSTLMSYTRLKAPDYKRLLLEAGFQIPCFDVTKGSAEDYEALEKINVHPCFSEYSRDDLAARHLFFAAQKPE